MNTTNRILVVEDDPEMHKMIEVFLKVRNVEFAHANTISGAIAQLLTNGPFDLIILDFWLGKSTAIPIMDSIIESKLGTPIILISGGNQRMDLQATEAIADISGAVIFLQKPFSRRVLLDAVGSVLVQ